MDLDAVAARFGSAESPVLFSGGLGTTYRSGNIVLKRTYDATKSEELATIIESLPAHKNDHVQIPRPIRSETGNWVEDCYVAWEYIPGEERVGHYKEKMAICDAFTDLFKDIAKPHFITCEEDPWSIADRITWDERSKTYDQKWQTLIEQVRGHLKPITVQNQLIHGDIAGNMLFTDSVPAAIDITLYWRPACYAKALLAMDVQVWEQADPKRLHDLIVDIPNIEQLLVRAALRRVIAQPEQVATIGKEPEAALEKAQSYATTLEHFLRLF